MKVNIQYTVNLKDIPEEAIKLLEIIKSSFPNKTLSNITSKINDGKLVEALTSIDSFRCYLADIDMRLEDVDTVLRGYITMTAAKPSENKEDEGAKEREEENVD